MTTFREGEKHNRREPVLQQKMEEIALRQKEGGLYGTQKNYLFAGSERMKGIIIRRFESAT